MGTVNRFLLVRLKKPGGVNLGSSTTIVGVGLVVACGRGRGRSVSYVVLEMPSLKTIGDGIASQGALVVPGEGMQAVPGIASQGALGALGN